MAILPSIVIERPPRMADFAHLGEAMFKALKIDGGFIGVYEAKRQLAADKALEGSGVAQAVQAFIKAQVSWRGTVGDLYDQLSILHTSPSAWPRSPRGLGDQLRVIAPAMTMMGYKIEFDPVRHNDGYHVVLGSISTPEEKSTHSQPSQRSQPSKELSAGDSRERREHREGNNLPSVAGDIPTEETKTVPWVAEV